MRRLSVLFAVLFVRPLLGSNSPKEYDDKTEIVDWLQGTWQLRRIGGPGKREVWALEERIPKTMTVGRGKFTAVLGDGQKAAGSYRADVNLKPARLDMLHAEGPHQGQTCKYLCSLESDTIRIDLNSEQGTRPSSVEEKGTFSLWYTREKK